MRDQKSSPSQSPPLVIMLAAFALLAGLYFSLRYAGWSMENDASSQATSAIGMVKSGELTYQGAYNNGFGYSAELAVISQITGLQVQDIQLGSAIWVVVVALIAFITFREFVGSAAVAGLGVLFLFLQPDFLFYIVRGGHEKYVWTYSLLMLFLLAQSYHYTQKPLKFIIYIGLFYITFWALISINVYFATTFMSAILLSFIGGWVLDRFGAKKHFEDKIKTQTLQRLIIISMACFILLYIFINYSYQPALQFYSLFTSLSDKISLLLLGTQPAEIPSNYQVLNISWRSQPIYMLLTGLQWLIVLISLAAWGIGLSKLSRLDQKPWLLWLMYSAFGFLLVFGFIADYAGFLNTNLQLRMFTPFTLFSSPLAAGLVVQGMRALLMRKRRLAVIASVAMFLIILFGAATVVMKVTNDPVFSNQWLFYTPAELAPSEWINKNGIQQQQVWVDTSEHLTRAYYFWEGYRPIIPYQYLWGVLQSPPAYTMISELTRLQANRSGISLPETDDQDRIYDNGEVQIYHRLPQTPYQR